MGCAEKQYLQTHAPECASKGRFQMESHENRDGEECELRHEIVEFFVSIQWASLCQSPSFCYPYDKVRTFGIEKPQ